MAEQGPAAGKWREGGFAYRIKREGEQTKPSVGPYYHIISSEDVGEQEEIVPPGEAEHPPEQDGALQVFSALANSGAVESHCVEVGKCDGTNAGKILTWLQNTDHIPEKLQVTVAEFTAKGAVLFTLTRCIRHKYTWPEIRVEIAHKYISADFCRVQRDRLRELSQ